MWLRAGSSSSRSREITKISDLTNGIKDISGWLAARSRDTRVPFIMSASNSEPPHIDGGIVGNEIPLPDGWDMATDFDGKVYYIDHQSKKTTWIDPRDR